MNHVTLRLRHRPSQRIDMGALNLTQLTDLAQAQITGLPLRVGNRATTVEELFEVAVSPAREPTVTVAGSCDRLDGLGVGTTQGTLEVFGDAGAFLARGMSGGRIEVHGGCGDYAATGMKGGTLRVHGSAGDFLGAALPGQARGLQGGTVVVDGDAGARVADRMRRGLLLIAGSAGEHCATRMIAGTVSVLGKVGAGLGFGMHRGTVLLSELPAALPVTFNQSGVHELTVLNLLRDSLSQSGNSAHARPGHRVRRWVGDRAVGGLGEVLLWV